MDRWQIPDRGEIGFYIMHESKEQNAVEFGTYSRAVIASARQRRGNLRRLFRYARNDRFMEQPEASARA